MPFRSIRLAALSLALGASALPAAAQQGGQTRTTQGDWTIICNAGGSDCAMEQLANNAQGQPILAMRVEKIAEPGEVNGERIDIVADILTPLGTILNEGLALKIDDAAEQRSPFFICQSNGCVVRAPLPRALLDQMRRGRVATFSFAMLQGGRRTPVSAPVSLTGFTRAVEALK